MHAMGVERYVVASNSLGGNIAWNLALDHPERVSALVLLSATGYPEKSLPSGLRLARNPLLRPWLRRWLPRRATAKNLRALVGAHSTIVDDAMVDRVHGLMSLAGNRSAFVNLANTDQKDRSREIARIAVPTLVLRSARIDGQNFARDIKDSRERVHPDAGHLLPEEEPGWVATEVLVVSMHQSGERPGAAWEAVRDAGLIGPRTNVVHGNDIPDAWLKTFVDAGASFTITPENELGQGHGFPITGRLMRLGAAPSLGTDIDTALLGELLIAARIALAQQRGLDHAERRQTTGLFSPRRRSAASRP